MKSGRLNWGIMGGAKIAGRLASALRESRFAHLYAIASRSLQKAEAFAQEFNVEKAYGSYQSLLEDPAVDVIYNPLPNHLHCEWTVHAIEHGKHVLCEKPMALSVRECHRMIAAASRHGVRLMEAFMYRFHPQTLKVQELLQRGSIGELRVVRACFGFRLDESSKNIRVILPKGGGSLLDVGCYCVNAMRTFFRKEPVAVYGHSIPQKNDTDIMFGGIVHFPGSRLGLFNSSFQTVLDCDVTLVGTHGRILIPSPWKPDRKLSSITLESSGSSKQIDIRNGGDVYVREVDHFSNRILRNIPEVLAPEDALRNMRVIEALQRSAKLHGQINLRSRQGPSKSGVS